MRKIFFACVLIGALLQVAFAQDKFATYTNERFGFSIDYPEHVLTMEPAPDNDDGRTFRSDDGKIEMLVWGQHNALSKTLDERYATDLKGFTEKPSYMVLKRDWYVISGLKEGKIFYEKTLVRRKGGDVFFTLTIEYPAGEKAKFDPIVKKIADSFKFDPDPNA
ncbi:MAG: hypothetical protein ABI878_04040 [Acidobacteriota bacterium]